MPLPAYQSPDELRTALAGLFTVRAVGRSRAVTMTQLQARVDIGRYGSRQVREAIAELVVIDGLPICGDSGCGYYRAETAEERLGQCREIARRIRALGRRLRIFAGRSEDATGGQLDLDYSLSPAEIAAGERRAQRLLDVLDAEFGED